MSPLHLLRRVAPAVAALAALGCAATGPTLAPGAQVTLAHADARVGTYVSKGWGFNTNTYWIEGPEGLVLIDTQFLPSAAEEALRWAEAATGKEVVLAVVLHPNPDKFNGTEVFQRHGVKVITSEQVRALIPGVFALRTKWFAERYAPDWPERTPAPEAFGAETREITAAGITFKAHVLGPGCSGAHVVVEYDGHLFTGDLVASLTHSWLELGTVDEWLERIDELEALKPEVVHPGRGPSFGPGLLSLEAQYLRAVKDLVLAEHPTLPPPEAGLERVKQAMLARYPGYDYEIFLEIGLPAVWEALAKGASAPSEPSEPP